MPFDAGATTALSAVSGAIVTSIKITEKVFEIVAVGEQSRSLLATINQVNHQLETAKTLRRQLSGLLSASEKESIELTFASTEEALQHVAKLVESPRVDQQIHGGKVGFRSRMQFVLRDSPNIVRSATFAHISVPFFLLTRHQVVSLEQLGITNQQLCTTVTMLHIRQSLQFVIAAQDNNKNVGGLERKPPPDYEESQMIAAARQKNRRKRAALEGLDDPTAAMVNDFHHLHQSPSTLSLPAELAGLSLGGRAEKGLDNLSMGPTLVDAMSDRSYHGKTRRSLPAELAGDGPRGRAENVSEMDSDRLSVTSTLVDDGDRSYQFQPGMPTTSSLGRARSRRWLEAHCSGV
jgi:hypothetical protein